MSGVSSLKSIDCPDLTAALDERGDADPRIGLRDRADMALDRELLASEARASGVTIVGTSYGSESIGESSRILLFEPALVVSYAHVFLSY